MDGICPRILSLNCSFLFFSCILEYTKFNISGKAIIRTSTTGANTSVTAANTPVIKVYPDPFPSLFFSRSLRYALIETFADS